MKIVQKIPLVQILREGRLRDVAEQTVTTRDNSCSEDFWQQKSRTHNLNSSSQLPRGSLQNESSLEPEFMRC
jgi:hypothetical protein